MMRRAKLFLLIGMIALTGVFALSARAQVPCTNCELITAPLVEVAERIQWEITLLKIQTHVVQEFTALKIWMTERPDGLFRGYWLPAFQQMTAQLSAVAMNQTMIFGALLDAKNQLETQQVLQKLSARTHKDYQPSIGLCEFGSGAKSLAASERKGEYNALVMSKRARDRELGSANTVASVYSRDKTARFEQFKKTFCDPGDSNGALRTVCETPAVPATPPNSTTPPAESKINKDIDYVRTVDAPWTLNVDFTDTVIDKTDEPEVLALASNLYGHDVFSRPSVSLTDEESQKQYMNLRSVIAKRSVAENSYNAIVGMKSAGTAGSKDYLRAIMKSIMEGSGTASNPQLDQDITKMIGENPSYYAQMEVLTKKMYQNPDFYTNLYDTPVNVARKGVALQAINLMQKFDLLKSYLRNEASMSVLLEIALIEIQQELEND